MKKEIRFKIIELPTNQVLVMKDYDGDEESESIVIVIYISDVTIRQTMTFDSEDKRDKAFDSYGKRLAKDLLTGIENMIK